jgi:hypothetical protein
MIRKYNLIMATLLMMLSVVLVVVMDEQEKGIYVLAMAIFLKQNENQ